MPYWLFLLLILLIFVAAVGVSSALSYLAFGVVVVLLFWFCVGALSAYLEKEAAKEARQKREAYYRSLGLLPVAGYDKMTIVEAKSALSGLSDEDLEQIHAYEKTHKNRKTLLHWIERKNAG